MARVIRNWHPQFIVYMELIVNHPNYMNYPYKLKKDGSIGWVVPGKSELGKKRIAWLENKRKELGIPSDQGWKSKVAYEIHPFKKKPCQVCGRELSLDYVYPNKSLVNQLNNCNLIENEVDECSNIRVIIAETIKKHGSDGIRILGELFNVQLQESQDIINITKILLEIGRIQKKLGPGAMSNPPDRLDGYHTYNRCCRAIEDTGRHKDNLNRYGDDRRAYENWADGNWKAANRLMREFNKHGVSADHIGPISLGFTHNPTFQPMTIEEQATKNNRMYFNDVKKLLEFEEKGEVVISWHSRFLWDLVKHTILSDKDAVLASKYLRTNLHYILKSLWYLYANGQVDFLKFLLHEQLEYSFYDYSFEGFDPKTGAYSKMIIKRLTGQNQINNSQRYARIALGSLQQYSDKSNRRISDKQSISPFLLAAERCAKTGKFGIAKYALEQAFKIKAQYLFELFLAEREK